MVKLHKTSNYLRQLEYNAVLLGLTTLYDNMKTNSQKGSSAEPATVMELIYRVQNERQKNSLDLPLSRDEFDIIVLSYNFLQDKDLKNLLNYIISETQDTFTADTAFA